VEAFESRKMTKWVKRKEPETFAEAEEIALHWEARIREEERDEKKKKKLWWADEPKKLAAIVKTPQEQWVTEKEELLANVALLKRTIEDLNVKVQQQEEARVVQLKRGPVPQCKHCGRLGHDEAGCWNLHPELRPEWLINKTEGRKGGRERREGPQTKKLSVIGCVPNKENLITAANQKVTLSTLGKRSCHIRNSQRRH
jgi:hypothetical protein